MPVPGTVLFIQHHSYAPPAMLGEAFTEAGYDVEVLALPDTRSETAEFPSALAYDAVVPLGAIVSVYDPDLAKSLVGPEMALLREADAAGVPVLGVCFGGQLLAQAHGGTVGQSPAPEIGWYPVTSDHPAVVPEGPWFQWHSDRWTLPPGAVEVAHNGNASQAFVLRRSLAVQFHPELDSDLLEQWLENHPAPQLNGAALDTRVLREHTRGAHDGAARRVRQLVAGFLGKVAGGSTLRGPA
jgi:GMP synthase-like glutamine amidotransferase